MKVVNSMKKCGKKLKEKVKDFFLDEHGGNLVEYALLIGFALFIFFLLVGVVTSLLDYTVGMSDSFTETTGGLDD